MAQFLETITSAPTVIFTVALLVSLGYWVVSTALGLGESGIDLDGGADVDMDVDVDVDVDADVDLEAEATASDSGPSGGLLGLYTALNLHLIPISLVITVISLAGWVTSILATVVLGGPPINTLLIVPVLVVSFVIGVLVSGRTARLLAPLFAVTRATSHRQLIGRLCVIRTGRVDDGFGQAEVVDAEQGTHLIQVRCAEANRLQAGDRALVVDVEDGVFAVSPDIEALGESNTR